MGPVVRYFPCKLCLGEVYPLPDALTVVQVLLGMAVAFLTRLMEGKDE